MVRLCLQAASRSTGATTSITGQAGQPVCEQVGICAAEEDPHPVSVTQRPSLQLSRLCSAQPLHSAPQPLQLQGVRGHAQHRHTCAGT